MSKMVGVHIITLSVSLVLLRDRISNIMCKLKIQVIALDVVMLMTLLMLQGKLIEIHFSETGKISGANIQTCKSARTAEVPG